MLPMDIMNALIATTQQIRDWTNKTKADKKTVNAMSSNIDTMTQKLDGMPNDLVIIDKRLYLAQDGKPLDGTDVPLPEGGGGGGGGPSTAITLIDKMPPGDVVVASGTPAYLKFYFESTNLGDGTAYIFVTEGNNSRTLKGSVTITNGQDNPIDVSPYIGNGTNIVDIVCSDRYGNEAQLQYTINVIKLSISTPFSDSQIFTNETGIPISIKFNGDIKKTLHFEIQRLDSTVEDYTITGITTNNASVTYDILKIVKNAGDSLLHGTYLTKVYVTATTEDDHTLTSNEYTFDIMFSEGKTTPLISTIYNVESITQGEQVNIPFTVFHTSNPNPEVTLSIEPSEQDGKIYLPDIRTVSSGVRQTWSTKNYPTGEVTFTISYGGIIKSHTVTVVPSTMKQQVRTDNMKFYISASGKSNESVDYDIWNGVDADRNIVATTEFENVNWSVTNKKFVKTFKDDNDEEVSTIIQYAIGTGWATDENGDTVLRLAGDARALIDFKPYAVDPKANGKTIELIFAIRDVNNRDAVAMSCMSNGVGFKITSDTATFTNGSTSAVCNYIDGEKLHITLVIEPQGTEENPNTRLFCAYLNGVMSSATQYTTSEILHQSVPVGISVGSSECSIDLYAIRTYDIALTKEEIRDNFIADSGDLALSIENDIYNGSEMLLSAVEKQIPVMRITGALPSLKKDSNKKKGGKDFPITVEYTDNINTELNFIDTALIHVQGTSSEGYPRKNWKIEFDNEHQHMPGMIPSDVFCMKCDFAENTGSHNTGNANYVHTFYGDIKTPPQEEDSRVRTTIAGFPCVIFHRKSSSDPYTFAGRYNFNYEKSSNPAYGLTEKYPNAESWEFRENAAEPCQFLADIPEDVDAWNGPIFEARYPDGSENIENFRVAHEWVVDTNQKLATKAALPEPYTDVDKVVHTYDTAEYRLAKFKTEFEDHFDLDFCLIYYLYTFVNLMVDQRAKNMFQNTWDGVHFQPWFYDNDTCLGINNEGKLVFDYYHQDYGENSKIGNQDVFNGGPSVLWTNFHQAFEKEIDTMYQSWRVSGSEKLSYAKMIKYFITDQTDRWSISMYNEDMEFKYIAALRNNNNPEYLYQVRGTGEEHFKYFVKNRLMFCDSKFFAGDFVSNSNRIVLRLNTPDIQGKFAPNSAISYKTFSNMYAAVRYGTNTSPYIKYTPRDTLVTLGEGITGFKDTDTYIFGADQISYLDDLSLLYCSTLNVSAASKLLELNVGRNEAGYSNPNLKSISFTNNRLLRKVNICNCNGFTQKVLDFTLCPDIQEILATGSNITGIDLPDSGYLKIAKLPDTIETLKIVNQKYIQTFECEGYNNLKSIRIENSTNIPIADILSAITDGNYPNIRIMNMEWNVGSEAELSNIINKAIKCKALDASGLAIHSTAIITGRVTVNGTVSDDLRALVHQYFPDLVVVDSTGNTYYFIDYLTIDGEIYTTELIGENEMPNGPTVNPTDIVMGDHQYIFKNWDMSSFKMNQNNRIAGIWHEQFAVKYYNGNVELKRVWATVGDKAIDPVDYNNIGDKDKIAIPEKNGTDDLHYSFSGWGLTPESQAIDMPIVSNVTILYAQYHNVHPVRFYVNPLSSTLHYTQWVKEGNDAHNPDPSTDEGYTMPPEVMVSANEKLVFATWGALPTNVTGICKVDATYDTYWSVRFWNKPTESSKDIMVDEQWVKDGESAVNPITRAEKPIETPTKDSTAQYDFKFRYWKCGELENVYANVTAARDIYAAYESITRSYTVKFWNLNPGGEPIALGEPQTVLYGNDAIDPITSGQITTPIKIGVDDPTTYDYTGWSPSYKNIQGDTNCYAVFRYNAYLFGKLEDRDNPDWDMINSYWTQIGSDVDAYKAGNMTNDDFVAKYPVGGRMLIPITFSDGSSYMADVEIIGYNHDELTDGTGNAALTFLCKDIPGFKKKIYDDNDNTDGWPGSALRVFLNDEMFSIMPSHLQNVIKTVNKTSDGGGNSKSLVVTDDKCWIPSMEEIGLSDNRFILKGQGALYEDTFTNGTDGKSARMKYLPDAVTCGEWWTRSSSYEGEDPLIFVVQTSGSPYPGGLWLSFYVVFGFCI